MAYKVRLVSNSDEWRLFFSVVRPDLMYVYHHVNVKGVLSASEQRRQSDLVFIHPTIW